MAAKKAKKPREEVSAVVTPTQNPSARPFASAQAMTAECMHLIKIARLYATVMASNGWAQSDTVALYARLQKVYRERGAFSSKRAARKAATAQFRAIVAQGLDYRDKVYTALNLLALTHPEVLDDVNMRLSKARTAGGLIDWFSSVSAVVSQYQADLRVQLGPTPAQSLASQIAVLDEAVGDQRERFAQRAALVTEQKQAVADLATAMVRLRRVGRAALVGNKPVLKELNRRSGFPKKPAAKEPSVAETPAAPAPDAQAGAAEEAAKVEPSKPAARS